MSARLAAAVADAGRVRLCSLTPALATSALRNHGNQRTTENPALEALGSVTVATGQGPANWGPNNPNFAHPSAQVKRGVP